MLKLLYSLYIPLLMIAAVLAAALAFYARKRITAPGAAMFVLLMVAVAVWTTGYALRLDSQTLARKTLWAKVQYVGMVVVPGAWLAFVAQFTGRPRWSNRRNLFLLAIEPAIMLLLVWTHPWHRLVWTETTVEKIRGWLVVWRTTNGIASWLHAAYSYVLLLVGTGLLVDMLVRSPRYYRGSTQYKAQIVALLIGLLAPWAANILSTLGVLGFPLDLTPLGFVVAGLVVTWALVRLRLFDVVPVARNAVLESITDGVFVLDTQGEVVHLNPAAQRMIGRPVRKAIAARVDELLPGYSDLAEEASSTQPGAGERLLSPDLALWVRTEEATAAPREQRWFEVRVKTLVAHGGHRSGELVILHDVTERNRQRTLYQVLRAVAGQLTPDAVAAAAVESIEQIAGWANAMVAVPGDGMSVWRVQAARGGLASLSGCQFPMTQGIVGRALRTAGTQLVPDVSEDLDALALHAATRSKLAVPLRRGEEVLGVLALESEQTAAFSAGDVRLVESLADAIALTLDNARLYQAAVDERQRLMTLIESSRDGIVLIGLDRRMLVVNAPAVDLLGLPGEPRDWTRCPVGAALDVLREAAPLAAKDLWAEVQRVEAGDEPAGGGEIEVFPCAIQWLSLPVMVEHKPLGRLLVLHDVTEERLLAKMREDLTHTMVHDLRNPLTGISTALQLLDSKLTEVITPAQHRLFEIAANSTQKMVDLVNSILDLSRLEKGSMPLVPEPVSVPDILAETLRLQSPLSSAKKLQVVSDLSPALPLAWADGELVARVLQNIIGNAIKFTPAGGTITVMARRDDARSARGENGDSADSFLRISVTDSGPGVPPDLQDKLFEKFVVGEQDERGSGLGLAFCKLAVEAHGGGIWVESGTGQGASFVFTLPAFDESEVKAAF
jgi:PAS domain S-box-containing protein